MGVRLGFVSLIWFAVNPECCASYLHGLAAISASPDIARGVVSMASSSSAMSPIGPPLADCSCAICMMNLKKREAWCADQCVEAAEVELMVAREELEAARARAEAAERNVMTLRSKAANARREADALAQLALRNSAGSLPPRISSPWWENERHAVVVTEDYTSVEPGVFSLRVGERLCALHRDRGGEWFFGVFPGQDDPLGWFPTKAVSPPAFLADQED